MKMNIKKEGCDCDHPEILERHPNGCTLNQIMKCHGEQSINELFKHVQLEDEKE